MVKRLITWLHSLMAAPELPVVQLLMLDVAIVTDDGTTLTCVMDSYIYADLCQDWRRAIAQKAIGQLAGCYWMEVNGQHANHGLLLTNIASLTGVVPTVKTESAT